MNVKHDTYRVTGSPEDGEHVGLCAEFASLSWLVNTQAALQELDDPDNRAAGLLDPANHVHA